MARELGPRAGLKGGAAAIARLTAQFGQLPGLFGYWLGGFDPRHHIVSLKGFGSMGGQFGQLGEGIGLLPGSRYQWTPAPPPIPPRSMPHPLLEGVSP